MSAQAFGLDIGTSSIKAALVKKDGNAFRLESIAVTPSTPKGLLSESLIDFQALADVIRKMLNEANLKITNVVFCLPESQVYTKIIEMPQLSDQELSAALKFEMEQYIPLPLDQVKTDWVVLSRSDSSGKKTMEVMIIAAPLNIVSKYEKLSEMLNLVPSAIESEVVSVHRALLPLVNNASSNMILHIGGTTSSICIVKQGIIKTVVSLPLGGIAITRAVSLDLGIDTARVIAIPPRGRDTTVFIIPCFTMQILEVVPPIWRIILEEALFTSGKSARCTETTSLSIAEGTRLSISDNFSYLLTMFKGAAIIITSIVFLPEESDRERTTQSVFT